MEKTASGLLAPVGTTCRLTENGLEVRGAQKSAVLPKELVERLADEYVWESCVAEINGKEAVIALFEEGGRRFPILCVDRASGGMRWRAEVWALGAENRFASSGVGHHNVMMAITTDNIAVFGEGTGGEVYVEVFAIESGEVKCRFSSGYWIR